jgi:raffinose/stachyose/melibiose transport system substrate-binding protein
MKTWKKVISSVLSVGIIGGMLAGCGTSSNSKASNQKVTINMFQFKVEIKDQLQALVKEYMKENPNVKINLQTVGGGADYGAALKTQMASGNEPTIFNIGGPSDVDTWKTKLADLSATSVEKAALPGTLDAVTKGGKVYGVPLDVEGYGLLYNKSVFKKAGIDPSTINTQKDLLAAVKKIDSQKSKLGLQAVFAFPAKETWVTGLHSSNVFLAPEFKNNTMDAYNAKTLNFTYADQFKQYVDMSNQYSVQPTNSLDYSTSVDKLFSTQKVAMIQQGDWVNTEIAGIDPNFESKDIGVLPIPVDGAVQGKIPVGVPMYWAVNSTSTVAQQKAAEDFLNWMNTSTKGKDVIVNQMNFIPAYKGYDNMTIKDALAKQIFNYANTGKSTGWVFMGYPSNWGMNVLGADIQKYVAGQSSWDQVVSDAKAQWAADRK